MATFQFYQVPFGCHSIDPIKESLIDAGFNDIRVHVIALEKEISNAAAFARGLVYGNPLVDEIRIRGGAQPDQIVSALTEAGSRVRRFRPNAAPGHPVRYEQVLIAQSAGSPVSYASSKFSKLPE